MKECDSNKLVLVDSYFNEADAYIVKGALETNGIPCVITNETISSVYPIPAMGGVKLWVRACDAELAQKLIAGSEK